MDHCTLAIICVFAALLCLGSAAAAETGFEGFQFSIPFEGVAEGTAPADLAGVTPRGEAAGFVVVRDGRFVLSETGEPIRFWATNLCFGGCFPPHDVAERMARRMASLGINCVRFHHMDAHGYPRGIWRNEGWGDFEHTDLHPEALDRLDYLIAQMKVNGIYANLNLHVSRTYGEKDGFPALGEGESVPNYGKGVDNFYPKCIEEQKRYARMLLRHVNRYTGNAYAEEPAVAMVEISNEDGLLREWKGGGLDRLPEAYVRELERQWNEWLSRTYGSTEALRQAWSEGEAPGGREDLLAGAGVEGHLQVIENARGCDRTCRSRPIGASTSSTSWPRKMSRAPGSPCPACLRRNCGCPSQRSACGSRRSTACVREKSLGGRGSPGLPVGSWTDGRPPSGWTWCVSCATRRWPTGGGCASTCTGSSASKCR